MNDHYQHQDQPLGVEPALIEADQQQDGVDDGQDPQREREPLPVVPEHTGRHGDQEQPEDVSHRAMLGSQNAQVKPGARQARRSRLGGNRPAARVAARRGYFRKGHGLL